MTPVRQGRIVTITTPRGAPRICQRCEAHGRLRYPIRYRVDPAHPCPQVAVTHSCHPPTHH